MLLNILSALVKSVSPNFPRQFFVVHGMYLKLNRDLALELTFSQFFRK